MESQFTTAGGIEVAVRSQPLSTDVSLASIYDQIDVSKGAIFSSGFDYPGRHSRWDIGFANPAVEFIAKGREFAFNALNAQGSVLIPVLEGLLNGHSHIQSLNRPDSTAAGHRLLGTLAPQADFFAEEERSRQPSVFSILRALNSFFYSDAADAGNFGLYGAFGYDLVFQFEKIQLKHDRTDVGVPDCHLFLPLELIVVDRKREVAQKITYSLSTPAGATGSHPGGGQRFDPPSASGTAGVTCDHAPGEFAAKVRKIIEGTERGDYFEVILSQTFSTPFTGKPTDLFKQLARVNPSPYMFLINLGTEQIVGASPEIYVRVTDRRYETCPISGTVTRGESALEDADQVRKLLNSDKEESELTMCTDVDRNDMARVCEPGSVRILGRRQLEFYSHLIHTVDHLEGTLRSEFDALDAFQTHMWACTVTGAPKPAALQEIEALENSPRGWYAGAIGFVSFRGNVNTGITLRTAQLRDGRAVVRAGATLLWGSSPEEEERETRTKAAAFLTAIADYDEQTADPRKAPQTTFKIGGAARKVLLVDCRDSFVHNLAAYLRELGCSVVTLRSGFPLEKLDEIKPALVLLSPGPGSPAQFGVPELVGELVQRRVPAFGVCLGHQGIGQHFGATLGQLPTPVHGKASRITHTGSPLFDGVESEFEAGRYHSLYLVNSTIPTELTVTAQTIRTDEYGAEEIIPMAVEHTRLPIAGVQFHPESLMTLKKGTGHQLLRNAIRMLT